jgi:hypothetical protein
MTAMNRLPALPDRPPDFSKKILLEDVWFKRTSRFTGHDIGPRLRIGRGLDRLYLRAVGRIENMQGGEARMPGKSHRKHFAAKARSAHAENHRVAIPAGFRLICDRPEELLLFQLAFRDVQPAEPPVFVGIRPENLAVVP